MATTTRRTMMVGGAALPLARPARARPCGVAIGCQLPLTGVFRRYGERCRDAAIMALEAFDAANRIPAPVRLVFEDTRSDPREAAAVARRFADDSAIVAVLGDVSSAAAIAAGRVHAAAGMPQLSPTASHPDYARISPWQFRNIATAVHEGTHVARWMAEADMRRVAVVATSDDWGRSAVSGFVDAFRTTGGEVVATEMVSPGTSEFRAVLTEVSRQRPDAIHAALLSEDGAALLRQKRELGIRAPVFGASAMAEPGLIERAGPDAEGLLLSTTFAPWSPEPHVRAYVEAHRRRFGSEPTMVCAQAFDAATILLEAIERSWPDVTRRRLRDELARTTGFPGVTGLTSFDPETREPAKTLARMRVENGRFEPVRG